MIGWDSDSPDYPGGAPPQPGKYDPPEELIEEDYDEGIEEAQRRDNPWPR